MVSDAEQSDVKNLQAQIAALTGGNGSSSGDNSTIGPDTIISNWLIVIKLFSSIYWSNFYNCPAIYTQPGGTKTTTIKNALSDLYNITSTENNLITSKYTRKIIFEINLSSSRLKIQIYKTRFLQLIWLPFKIRLIISAAL